MSGKAAKMPIGIDEAGRGPLAGPMVIGAVSGISERELKGIKDSKKLTAREREEWFSFLKKRAVTRYTLVSHQAIDTIGLSRETKKAIARLLKSFSARPNMVLLDGGLYAPREYQQQTIIKGDEREPLIAAASIIAKVTRDRMMVRFHKKYPLYGFDLHKGYGTLAHRLAIQKHGMSEIHRKSFCTRIL